VSLSRSARVAYSANRPGVKFRCRLRGPGHRGTSLVGCPTRSSTGSSSNGSVVYRHLAASPHRYVATVQAYVPAATGRPEARGRRDTGAWRVYSVYSPRHYSPPAGARFNTPIGGLRSRRANLNHVIRTINSMPGYAQGPRRGGPCPTRAAGWPATIRISLYSMVDGTFARAMKAAHRRCVSVQILMNNHLNGATDHPWRLLARSLGTSTRSHGVARRSFAKRCHYGCRGHGVLHTKMYLFDSDVPAPYRSRNRIRNTVMVGSSNITSNASRVQWNDLFTIRGNGRVHADYAQMFNRMKSGRKSSRLVRYAEGKFGSTFWPQGRATDPYKRVLGAVRCRGANGGSGIAGRTVVYINMHAWFGTRGGSLARQVRRLYNRGCYVRVLYGFMSFKVYRTLHRGTGHRMSVRRTLFSHNGRTAYLYSHMKNIDISGHVGGDRSTWLAYTGSNNFTNSGTHYDEVMLRIRSHPAYVKYVRHFKSISRRRSSAVYANFTEPTGGGRAP
jgi:phosphatidylserine/phosphatidylglycerophosphate/cardiolipin synthase-like enzyme